MDFCVLEDYTAYSLPPGLKLFSYMSYWLTRGQGRERSRKNTHAITQIISIEKVNERASDVVTLMDGFRGLNIKT